MSAIPDEQQIQGLLEANEELQGRLKEEKERRCYYQGIVYDVCEHLDTDEVKVVCGTIEEPSDEVQVMVKALVVREVRLQDEVDRLWEELKHAKMYSTTDDVLEVRTEVERLGHEIKAGHNREIDITAEVAEARNAAKECFEYLEGNVPYQECVLPMLEKYPWLWGTSDGQT